MQSEAFFRHAPHFDAQVQNVSAHRAESSGAPWLENASHGEFSGGSPKRGRIRQRLCRSLIQAKTRKSGEFRDLGGDPPKTPDSGGGTPPPRIWGIPGSPGTRIWGWGDPPQKGGSGGCFGGGPPKVPPRSPFWPPNLLQTRRWPEMPPKVGFGACFGGGTPQKGPKSQIWGWRVSKQ